MRRLEKGLSIIEVIVAMAILSGLVYAFMLFQSMTTRTVKLVTDSSDLSRALVVIERSVMEDMVFIPPQIQDDPAEDSPIFSDAEKAGLRCYDKSGNQLDTCTGFETDNGIAFRARFYKVRVQDQSVDQNSPLSAIPVSRVRFRVDYKINFQVQSPLFFSRLVTEVLRL